MLFKKWLNAILLLLVSLAFAETSSTSSTVHSTSKPSSTPKAAGSTLGITKDKTDEGYFHWSSVAKFEKNSKLDDLQEVSALAKAAYDEMVADAASKDTPTNSVPSAMTALSIPNKNQVYFSSSITGGAFTYSPGPKAVVSDEVANEVKLALERCQTQSAKDWGTLDGGGIHRTGAACGEPLAAQQYCVDNKDSSPDCQELKKQKAFVATWGKQKRSEEYEPQILKPCTGSVADWGCKEFSSAMDFTAMEDEGFKPGAPTISPESTRQACFWD